MNAVTLAKLRLLLAMAIFGTTGLMRRSIPLPSSVIALSRAAIGTLFLLGLHLAKKQRFPWEALRKNLPVLALSGICLGADWILLFEAYRYTSVSVATVCYYMAPVFVLLAAPLVFGEELTMPKCLCALAAVAGIVLVSGVLETGVSSLAGVLLSLAGAATYAAVILLNRFVKDLAAFHRTICLLALAALAMLPYVLFTEDLGSLTLTPQALAWLAVAGIVHTGFAYALYFGAIRFVPAHTLALFSYLDPVIAVLLSVFFLHEPLGAPAAFGVVLVIGAALAGELVPSERKRREEAP